MGSKVMVQGVMRTAPALRRLQLDAGAGDAGFTVIPGDGSPPNQPPEAEVEATDIGPPSTTSRRTPSRRDSQPSDSHDRQPSGRRGGPQSQHLAQGNPQAKREKKLAKKARQKKAAKRRATLSQPGRGLVEEVLEPASSSFSPSHAPR